MAHVNQNQLSAVSEIQISYKPEFRVSERLKINSSREAYELLSQWNPELIEYVEEFKMLLLNKANRVLV